MAFKIALCLSIIALTRSFCFVPGSRRVPTGLFAEDSKIEKGKVVPDTTAKADPVKDSYEYNKMSQEDIDRYGPGTMADFVDFEEFDGGDGQMGVAGDGQAGLEAIGRDTQKTVVKTEKPRGLALGGGTSRERSAKNAWGSSSGYAEELVAKGVDTARAQQFENYANQIELNKVRKAADELASLDESKHIDEDWRMLGKFGVERNQDFDLEQTFGPVVPDLNNIEEEIVMKANVNALAFQTILLRNPFMGFLDFRAALSDDSPLQWKVEPQEGNISQKKRY